MTRIEDRLADSARQLRHDIEATADVDAAVSRTLAEPAGPARSRVRTGLGRSRVPMMGAVAALLAVVTVATVVLIRDDDNQLVTDEGPPSTSVDEAISSTPADTGPAFDLLGDFAVSESFAGSMMYAGVPDALADRWMVIETAEPAPTVDFDRQAVLAFTVSHWEHCPQPLASLDLVGSTVTPVFTDRGGDRECGAEVAARTYLVAVDRDAVPERFTLVLVEAPDGSYAEQRLDVDLSTNFASSSPRIDAPELAAPMGPDLQAPEPGREITFDGAGDVHLGQVLDPSEVDPHEGDWSCGYWGPLEPSHDGDEPLSGLFTGNDPDSPTVLSIMVWRNPDYRTASGVGVGTTLSTLDRIYGEDLTVDRADGWDTPTDGLLASYRDVAAVRNGDTALTFYLVDDVVQTVKVSYADFWGDDEGCA